MSPKQSSKTLRKTRPYSHAKDFPNAISVDLDVESHSEGFKLKYGRYPAWDEEEDFCDEFWFDPIYLKIRAMVKERTGK